MAGHYVILCIGAKMWYGARQRPVNVQPMPLEGLFRNIVAIADESGSNDH